MVRKKSYINRFAFTMIELVFAIVIIGITVVSLPMMTQVTSRGIDNNFVQEAIFAGGAEVMQALSYRWDLNSAENATAGEISKVLNIAGDCNALSKRPGNIKRSCYSDLTNVRSGVAANAADAVIENLNNAAVANDTIFTGVDGSGYGYKKNYTQTTTVAVAGFGGVNNGNFKRIQTTVTDPVNGTQVILEAYSANIGEVEPLSRSF